MILLWVTLVSLATSIASNALIMKIPMSCNESQIHSKKSFTFENSLEEWLSFSFAIVSLLIAYHILDFVYRNYAVLAIGAYMYIWFWMLVHWYHCEQRSDFS